MEPEFTTHRVSPHARVECVQCHVGSDASWFVRYKLIGAKELIDQVMHTYPRPFPAPIVHLRPARDTCEECHWPAKFFGIKLLQIPHFRYDEKNTPGQISLGLKVSGWVFSGIHFAHVVGIKKMSFVPLDRHAQDIPWVAVTRNDGTMEEYMDRDYQGPPVKLAALRRETFDCIGCHNRPTHIFSPPDTAVDMALAENVISRSLPWIKKVAVDALVMEYSDRKKAHEGLRNSIVGFYQKQYPHIYAHRKKEIEGAVSMVIQIHNGNVFPQMRVNWKTYPSNYPSN